jgi:hypothetical protein
VIGINYENDPQPRLFTAGKRGYGFECLSGMHRTIVGNNYRLDHQQTLHGMSALISASSVTVDVDPNQERPS